VLLQRVVIFDMFQNVSHHPPHAGMIPPKDRIMSHL
jgi:hypothetical protein